MPRAGKTTTDHDAIRNWAEKHGGHPASVKGTGRGEDPGILRIDFPGFSDEQPLEPIPWETFFEWFDKNELALVFRDQDRFNKLVSRKTAETRAGAQRRRSTRGKEEAPTREAPTEAPNAIDLLMEQHREARSLFDKIEKTSDKEEREVDFHRLANALAAHGKIEETIFYPTVMSEPTEAGLRRSVEEHLLVKRILADLTHIGIDNPQFDAKLSVLKEVFFEHAAEEEQQLFKMVGRVNREVLRDLGDMMQTAYRDLMEGEPSKQIDSELDAAARLM